MPDATPSRCARCLKMRPCDCAPRNRHKLSSTKRGYDSRHRKLRQRELAEQPLCEDCLAVGRTTPAVDIHHVRKVVDAPELRLDRANRRRLCKACHEARTARGE